MRRAAGFLAVAVALSGCAVKGGLSSLTGKKSSNGSNSSAASASDQGDASGKSKLEEGDWRAEHNAEAEAGRLDLGEMVVIEPADGMPAVGAIDIDWCDLVPAFEGDGRAVTRWMEQAVERGWSDDKVVKVGTYLCINPADPKYRQQAGYFVQSWVNETGLAPKQMIANLKLRMQEDRWEQLRTAHCETLGVSDEASDAVKAVTEARQAIIGCSGGGPTWTSGSAWMTSELFDELDRSDSTPPQDLLAFRALSCADPRAESLEPKDMIRYASCGRDLQALSDERMEAEIKKAGYNEYAAAVMRETMAFTHMTVRRYEAEAKALSAKDNDWKTIFAAPEKAWKSWDETWKRHGKILRAAAEFETLYYGPSRKAARGCRADLRGYLLEYVRSKKATDSDRVKAAMTDEVGAQLLTRLAGCELVEGNKAGAFSLAEMASKARATRGPRYAVYYALVETLAKIKADRERFPLGPADVGHSPQPRMANQVSSRAYTSLQEDKGVVKAVTTKNGGVVVSFKKDRWKEPAQICEDTKKVWRVDESGNVLYFKKCRSNGFETMEHTAKTIWLPKEHAAGIKPGSFVRFAYDLLGQKDGFFLATVYEVYASKKQKKLINFHGLEM